MKPAFPFQMMLTRAEEAREERRRDYLRQSEGLRCFQEERAEALRVQDELLGDLAARREQAPGGSWEQNHMLYVRRQAGQLEEMRQHEDKLRETAEEARQQLLQAAMQLRVWESLRDRFLQDWEARLRRQQEAELEDWTRANFKSRRPGAVV